MSNLNKGKPNRTFKTELAYVFMFIINHIFGVRKNKFFFEGMGGKYNDNARAVSEKLHEMHPDAIIVWAIDESNLLDPHIPRYIVKAANGFARLYHRATSYGWVSCLITSNPLYKSHKQVYVQCWHGDRPMKKILRDVCEMYIYESCHSDCTTSGSSFYTGILGSAFNFEGKVIESGCPRNDVLISPDKNKICRIKQELGIDENQKVLLYAPTFRDSDINFQKENLNLARIIKLLNNKDHKEWICLGRFHPSVKDGNMFNSKEIKDVTRYYDMADLLLISDMIITDYSSSASDFSLTRRPVFLYQPDRSAYISQDRELYFDLDNSPYWIAKSQEELERLILEKSENDAVNNCLQIDAFYGTHETGHASEDVVNFLFQKLQQLR